jgi:hypothetical protein
VSKSSWSTVFTHSNSNSVNSSATLEEFFNGPLFSSESKVSNENGVGLTSWCTIGATLWLVSSSSLSTEFNPDGSTIEVFLVSTVECGSSVSVIGILDESFSLGLSHTHKEFAFSKFTVGSEELS